MISNKQFVAIDLGSSRISAMAGEMLENGALKILSVESKKSDDVKSGIVEQHTGAAFKVSELKRCLQNSSKIPEISLVSVSVGAKTMRVESASVSRFVGKPNVITDTLLVEMSDECERKRMSRNDSVEIFDIIPASYFIDGKRMDEPSGENASQIIGNYNLVTGSSNIKIQRDRCFEKTGLVLEYTPLEVQALSTVLMEDKDREDGCALINFGASSTTLAIYADGILQKLTVVPLGSRNITKDIEQLGISEDNAERLKVLTGVALESMVTDPIYVQIPSVQDQSTPVRISTKFLATIIEARLEEIMQPIFDEIEKISFPLNAGIIISGGGSKLTNLIDFIVEKTGIYTRFGDHSEWLSDDSDKRYFAPDYSQLVGTIILTNEYRKEHPIEETIKKPEKEPKIKKKPFDKLADKFITFFGDDNKF